MRFDDEAREVKKLLAENAKLTRALALIQLTEGIVVQGDPRGFVWKHQIIANDALSCAERKEEP